MKLKQKTPNKLDKVLLTVHVIEFVLLSLLSAGALRQNNLNMLALREAVFVADKNGEGLGIALTELRDFVSTRMNTHLPKLGSEKAIQLKYSYERAVNSEQVRFQVQTSAVGVKAKNSCSGLKNELVKVECEQAYIKSNPVAPINASFPEEYSIEYVSPTWSFDLAGWLIIISFISGASLFARLTALMLAKKYIKKNYY